MGEAAYQRAANPEELDSMKKMVREGMELGAIGFSTSPRGGPAIHAGTPSTFAEHDEIIELANVTDEYNGCFQFNGFQMILQPESGVPEMLTKIHGLQIGNYWPHTVPPLDHVPAALPFDTVTPRNCMPSMHTAWATTVFLHSRRAAEMTPRASGAGRLGPTDSSPPTSARTSPMPTWPPVWPCAWAEAPGAHGSSAGRRSRCSRSV